MNGLHTTVLIIHTLIALAIIGLVLLQRGKGAEAGAAFGAGASGTVFGARGSTNFFSRTTAILATAFFATSLTLAYISSQSGGGAPDSVIERVPTATEQVTEQAGEVVDEADAAPLMPALDSAAPAVEDVGVPPLDPVGADEVPQGEE